MDVTALAKRHGWERIACYAIEEDYHWQTDSNATEYWHYERTDGLVWWEVMDADGRLGWLPQIEMAVVTYTPTKTVTPEP